MSETTVARPAQGSCLCGKIRYQIHNNLGIFQNCHCSRCRKVTGSMFGSNLFARVTDFEWLSGEELLGRYEPADARYYATSFCKHCGSNLPWLSRNGKTMIVPAGTLDEDPGVRPNANIFMGSKAAWHTLVDGLPGYDELPPR